MDELDLTSVEAKATYKEIEECMKKVSFYERYQSMENGPDTYLYKDISENGVEITVFDQGQIVQNGALRYLLGGKYECAYFFKRSIL